MNIEIDYMDILLEDAKCCDMGTLAETILDYERRGINIDRKRILKELKDLNKSGLKIGQFKRCLKWKI